MRPVPLRLLSLAVLPAALLAGCADAPAASPSSSGSASSTPSAQGDFQAVTVTPGAAGAAPTLTLPTKPLRVSQAQSKVLKEGTGEVIKDRAWLDVTFYQYSGVDAAQMATSGTKTATLRIGEDDGTPDAFAQALKGKKVGSQVLVAVPASKILNEQQLRPGMTLDDTVLYVIDVVGSRPVLDKATGTAVPPVAGMPTVEVPDDAKQPAKITVPSPTPLTTTVAQPLITGAGKPVVKGQTVRVRYTGVTWADPGKPFDYSGKQTPPYAEFPIGTGQLIKAWDNLIPGKTVGSRLLIIVQPADGYGAQGGANGAIKGTDVLIFVLDILDAYGG